MYCLLNVPGVSYSFFIVPAKTRKFKGPKTLETKSVFMTAKSTQYAKTKQPCGDGYKKALGTSLSISEAGMVAMVVLKAGASVGVDTLEMGREVLWVKDDECCVGQISATNIG